MRHKFFEQLAACMHVLAVMSVFGIVLLFFPGPAEPEPPSALERSAASSSEIKPAPSTTPARDELKNPKAATPVRT